MRRAAPSTRSLHAGLLGLAVLAPACSPADDPTPADTDATSGTATSSPTSVADDAPPLDSTGDEPGTVGPDTETSAMTLGMTDGSGSSSDDGPTSCEGDNDCTEADAPFCVDSLCAACSATGDPDAACAEKFPETPACVASECVQCSRSVAEACTGTTPLCDPATNTCVGCATHADCPDSACHIPYPDAARATDDDGACFDPATVVHVDRDGGQDFTTIGAAANSFGVAAEGVIIVHEAATSYNEAASVSGNRVLAILAAPGESPQWIQSNNIGGPQLSLANAATTVFLDRMRLAGNSDSSAAAVNLDNGRVHVQRSELVNNTGGGIAAENGALVYVETSFIGGDIGFVATVSITGSDASILYSSLTSGSAGATTLTCSDASVEVRNSILLTGETSDAVDCAGISIATSGTEASVGAFDGTQPWFDNYFGGDHHLTAQGVAIFCDIASWQDGDPATDIDGEARPTVDGSPDCAGADVPAL